MPAEPTQLVSDLDSTDLARRVAAAEQLCRLGEGARAAAVALVRAAGDPDEDVRQLAAGALEDMGSPDKGDVQPLAALLSDSSPEIGYWAATLLGRLGPDAGNAVDALAENLCPTKDLAVRQRAAWALGQIGPAAAAAVQTLQSAASDDNPRLARVAAAAIEQINVG